MKKTLNINGIMSSGSLSIVTKFAFGVGHVFNDLCASMWFSYLLLFFQRVLLFSESKAGVLMFVGQIADGLSTPVVGILSDRENKLAACARYGRRKVWHLLGTFLVLLSFPFIFSKCVVCHPGEPLTQMIYYCCFVVIFQFGWASVQISHLSLIPELTHKKHGRTELNSIRYAFTVLSNLSVYAVAFAFLSLGSDNCIICDNDDNNNQTNISILNSTTIFPSTEDTDDSYNITPEDAPKFRNIALFCICAGALFSALFHMGVKEPLFVDKKKEISNGDIEKMKNDKHHKHHMAKSDWFKEIAFYQVAILYMATRLFVNLYQVYIPLYVQHTLRISKNAVATVPFGIYFAGFLGSLVMKPINKKIGRKGAFSVGCVIGLIGCIGILFGSSEAFKSWGVYLVTALLGIGGSTLLITSLSITSDLIGSNVEGGAFVYGFMSLVDKFSNGIVIMLIQKYIQQHPSKEYPNVYKYIITYFCGASCILGLMVAVSLIPVKVGKRKGISKKVAELVDTVEEVENTKSVLAYPPTGKDTEFPSFVSKKTENGHIDVGNLHI